MPSKPVTRAHMSAILARIYKANMNNVTAEKKFSDVETDAWFSKELTWGVDNAVIEGYKDGTFRPNNNMTRQQFVTTLYRLSTPEQRQFTPVNDAVDMSNVSDYAMEAMRWAMAKGIVQGDTYGRVNPKEPVTRVAASAIIMRYETNVK